jgi:SAM-dependent methyltransferase
VEVATSVGAARDVVLEVDRQSYWGPFTTHFPALARYLEPGHRTACVLGASDGKFAIPLAKADFDVTGVDLDEVFLFGGRVSTADGSLEVKGLAARLAEEGLEGRCRIVVCDYMEWETSETFDVVVTSGSWSMPENARHRLRALVARAQDLTAPGGLLFADYLAELPGEQTGEHYPPIERVRGFFSEGWEVLENADLGLREERHYDKPELHHHRFAAVIARKARA